MSYIPHKMQKNGATKNEEKIFNKAQIYKVEFSIGKKKYIYIGLDTKCDPSYYGSSLVIYHYQRVYGNNIFNKTILEDLFFNRLDIHTSLPMWTRNTCKYGDNFLFINIDDKAGVIGVRQLPTFEMERRENDMFNTGGMVARSSTNANETEEPRTKFVWRGREMEFNSWQIAHFRLLGDDRKLPYGTSVLEKARRIWKQLILSEDAMLVYRVTRAPERRVFKIFVGNIEDEAIEPYIQKIANKFKRTQVIDPQTGQIDLRLNQLAVDQDYFIPVRDTAAPSPIDTLPGASNLDQIADIECYTTYCNSSHVRYGGHAELFQSDQSSSRVPWYSYLDVNFA